MRKTRKLHSTFIIALILCLVCFIVFIGCLLLYKNNDTSLKNATIVLTMDASSPIAIDNSMPITDALGKELTYAADQTKYGYREFSLSSNLEGLDEVDYEIYVRKIGVPLELSDRYVKVYLTDEDNQAVSEEVSTFDQLKVSESDPSGRQLYTGTLKKDEEQNFKLRVWLKDTYPIMVEVRSFAMKIYVKVID